MKLPIRFAPREEPAVAAVRSVVSVRFPGRAAPLAYCNSRFSLRPGNTVFVSGKYQGTAGRVERVSTDFHIRPEDYQQVLGVADTGVRGTFRLCGGCFLTFDGAALPYRQVLSWHRPAEEETCYVRYGEEVFPLAETDRWPFSPEILDRGAAYSAGGNVACLRLEGEQVRAIVQGSRAYEVSLRCAGGMVSGLSCDCPCAYPCKHQAAVLYQLRRLLALVEERYAPAFRAAGGFTAVARETFLTFALERNPDVLLELR